MVQDPIRTSNHLNYKIDSTTVQINTFFYLFIAFLSLFHNEFIPSIVFEFFKFRFYNCTIKTSDDIKLERKILSRNRLNLCNGEEVYLKHINNECSIDVTPRDSVS